MADTFKVPEQVSARCAVQAAIDHLLSTGALVTREEYERQHEDDLDRSMEEGCDECEARRELTEARAVAAEEREAELAAALRVIAAGEWTGWSSGAPREIAREALGDDDG